jgi:hypothetical protein
MFGEERGAAESFPFQIVGALPAGGAGCKFSYKQASRSAINVLAE